MPAEHVHPVVVEAMREIGVDLADELPQLLAVDAVRTADVVISMGCGDACPVFPGKSYRDLKTADPKGGVLADVRVTRDEIRARVEELVRELDARDQSPYPDGRTARGGAQAGNGLAIAPKSTPASVERTTTSDA